MNMITNSACAPGALKLLFDNLEKSYTSLPTEESDPNLLYAFQISFELLRTLVYALQYEDHAQTSTNSVRSLADSPITSLSTEDKETLGSVFTRTNRIFRSIILRIPEDSKIDMSSVIREFKKIVENAKPPTLRLLSK